MQNKAARRGMIWIFGMFVLAIYTELCYLGHISYYPDWVFLASLVYIFGGFIGLIAWHK